MRSRTATSRSSTVLAIAALLVALVAALSLADGAAAKKGGSSKKGYLPPSGKIYAGVSDTGQGSDYRDYRDRTGAHPAVMQSFESWGYIPREAIRRWDDSNTRGMISLSTAKCWGCPGVISPGQIAAGKGDRYILSLAAALAKRGEPTYIRLMPEMNGFWNDYSAYHGKGAAKGGDYTTANYKQAWRRFVLIARGGDRKAIDKKLKKLKLPKIQSKTKSKLPRPKIAFAWVPQSSGSPNVPGNQPDAYFPGYSYVDWVGADIYGKYPNFDGLNALYKRYDKVPFLIGEWAPWGADDPSFVNALLGWVESHSRTRMAIYYQGFGEGKDNPFEVTDYRQSLTVLRHHLKSKRYVGFTAENVKKAKKKPGHRGSKGGGKASKHKGKGKRGGKASKRKGGHRKHRG